MAEVITAAVDPGGRDAIFRRELDMESVARRIVDVYRLALGERLPCARSNQPASAVGSVAADRI
jgi:hypothetical protein